MASKIFAVASLIALATAQSQGGATVQNHCGTTVYYKTKIPGMSNSVQSFGPNDAPLSFPYPAAGAAGWNVLFSPDQDSVQSEQDVSQLEITHSAATGGQYSAEAKIWYDLSNVNSSALGMAKAVTTYPFAKWGFTLSSNQQGCGAGAPNNCQSCGCEAGQHDCTDAYQYWNDDARAMHDTTPESTVTLSLCMPIGGSSDSSSSGAGSSAAYSAAPSSTTAAPIGYGSSSSPGSQTTFQTQYTPSASTLGYANFKPAVSAVSSAASAVESEAGNAVTTTVVSDAVVTQFVQPGKRHLHQHQHAHHHAHHE